MLNAELLTEAIQEVQVAGFFLAALAGETICKLAAVIGQQFDEFDRTCFRHFGQEIDADAICLISVDLHVDPTCSAADGDEQITPLLLVWHLRQVLDIYM